MSLINRGLAEPPTKGIRLDGSFIYPETPCEVAGKNIRAYVTEADVKKGFFDAKCGEVECELYGCRTQAAAEHRN